MGPNSHKAGPPQGYKGILHYSRSEYTKRHDIHRYASCSNKHVFVLEQSDGALPAKIRRNECKKHQKWSSVWYNSRQMVKITVSSFKRLLGEALER